MIFVLAVVVSAGCEKQGDKYYLQGTAPDNDRLSNTLSEDPDKRAEAITYYSNQDWGRRGAYVDFYATAAQRDRAAIVRSTAVRALGRVGDPKYVPVMAGLLADPVAAVRWDAAVALDCVWGPAAVAPLQKVALEDANVNARVAAIRALRHYRDVKVLETLVRCLADSVFGVAYEAHNSLVEITGQDAGFDVDNWVKIISQPLPERRPERPWWAPRDNAPKPESKPATKPIGG